MSDHEPINMEAAERIAFADTKHLGRPRWSELSVFYLNEPTASGKRWLAISAGLSDRANERTLSDRLCTFSLERALDLFDESPIGRQVRAQALDWAEHNAPGETAPGETAAAIKRQGKLATANDLAPAFDGATDEEALAFIFGPRFSMRGAAEAFDMGESTLRMALRNRTAVRVPLVMVARYFDRERFLSDLRGKVAADA